MADNVIANAGAGGATFSTDDIAGIHWPFSKLAWGPLDTANVVDDVTGKRVPVKIGEALPAGTANIGDVDVLSLPAGSVAAVTAKTLDYDSGAGVDTVPAFGILLPKSGGAVAGGTSTDPVRVDVTGTTTQPVSGTVTVTGTITANAGTGDFLSVAAHTVNEALKEANCIAGQLDDTTPTAATENNVAPVRITAQIGRAHV